MVTRPQQGVQTVTVWISSNSVVTTKCPCRAGAWDCSEVAVPMFSYSFTASTHPLRHSPNQMRPCGWRWCRQGNGPWDWRCRTNRYVGRWCHIASYSVFTVTEIYLSDNDSITKSSVATDDLTHCGCRPIFIQWLPMCRILNLRHVWYGFLISTHQWFWILFFE